MYRTDLAELCFATSALDVPHHLLLKTTEVALHGFGYVEERHEQPVSFVCCADVPEPHALPAGWWVVYAWTDPEARGTHVGTAVLLEAFRQFDPLHAPYLTRKPDPSRTWSGRFGYEPDDRPWSFLDLKTKDYQLFTASRLDLGKI